MASSPAPLPSLGLLDGLGTAVTPATDSPAFLPSMGLLGGLGGAGVPVITSITPIASGTVRVVYTGSADEARIDGGTPFAIGSSPADISGLDDNEEFNSPGLELRRTGGDWGTPEDLSDPMEFGTWNEGEGGGGLPIPVSTDLGLAYNVRAAVTADRALAYNIVGTATADRPLAYNVRAAVSADQALAYNLRAAVTADLGLAYNVRAAVSADQALAYNLRAAVSTDLELAYQVEAQPGVASSDLGLAYNVRAAVAADQALAYGVRAAVQADLALAYNVRTSVSADLALAYDLAAAVGGVGAAAVWQRVIEDGLTAEEILRVILAAVSGRTTGLGTATETYLSRDGAKPRLVVEFDESNNRTSVTLDVTP